MYEKVPQCHEGYFFMVEIYINVDRAEPVICMIIPQDYFSFQKSDVVFSVLSCDLVPVVKNTFADYL